MLRSTLLLLVLILAGTFGCGGPPSSGGGQQSGPASTVEIPELTDDIIRERINYARVREVPEETGATPPITWSFDHDEPKEIKVIDRQMNSAKATLVLDIKTESAPGARIHRKLAGQMRTEWELETGWVLRKWEIKKTENISIKYKDFAAPPTPPPGPANAGR